jgi:hypothetical protein
MIAVAMSLLSVLGCWAFATQNILFVTDWLKMSRIYAIPVAAHMIQFEPSRNWAY